jgi:asparagine synthase (glutamine-hydrolysing)
MLGAYVGPIGANSIECAAAVEVDAVSGLSGCVGQGAGIAHAVAPVPIPGPHAPFQSFVQRNATVAVGSVTLAASPGDGDLYSNDEGDVAAIWGKANFADSELASIARRLGVARALAQGFSRKGADVVRDMSGQFALVVLSSKLRQAILATDHLGIHPLFYFVDRGRLVFGSSLDLVATTSNQQPEIDPQAIYHYVYFHMVPGPRTIYAQHRRLPAASVLMWRNGEAVMRSYREMRFIEDRKRSFAGLKDEFIDLLRESVRTVAQEGRVGAFLSGGTDSSTVAGMLREVSGERPRTYSIGFAAEGYDEMQYARIAARHFGTDHHEHYMTAQDVVEAIPLIAMAHDQPFGNASAVPAYYCAKLAKDDGVQTMLGGDGGDELFGGNERYAKQYLYSLYSDLPRVVRKGLIEPLICPLPENLPLIGKVQRYIRNASQPMPGRYDNYNLLERLGAETVFRPEFLDTVDRHSPAAEMAQLYWAQSAQSMTNRMLGFDLKYTLEDNDLLKVMRACQLAGVVARFPLLNDKLVAFSATLPPDLKVRRTRLRYFFKEALRGFLPEEIIKKTKHGFGLPVGPWLKEHEPLREMAFDSLADLKRRGLVNSHFIDELCSSTVWSHTQYYGTMVWVLMMLEQWFKRSGRLSTATIRRGLTEQAA